MMAICFWEATFGYKSYHLSDCYWLYISCKNNIGQGWKLQNNSACPSDMCLKDLPVRHYFLVVHDSKYTINVNISSFPSDKCQLFFTCPPLFLPVTYRWTVCNFHPCRKSLELSNRSFRIVSVVYQL